MRNFTAGRVGPQPDHTAAAFAPPVEPIIGTMPPPDPKKAPALTMSAMGHLVSLVESIIGTVPQLHGMAARVAALRKAFEDALYHASPPAEIAPRPKDAP